MQLELVLTAATLCIAIVGVISGLFGMNLTNTHEGSYTAFILVRAPSLSLKHVLASVPRVSRVSCPGCTDAHLLPDMLPHVLCVTHV